MIGRGPKSTVPATALLVLLVACGPDAPQTESEPEPAKRSVAELKEQLPPSPPLDQLEAPVRRQFEEREFLLRSALDNAGAGPADRAWALGQMGRLHQAYRHLDAALWFLEAAHEQDPSSFEWVYLTAHLHKVLGSFEAAERFFQTALELRPEDAAVWAALAGVAVESGRPKVARERFEKAIELNGTLVVARYELALLDLAEGHAADAAIALEKLLEEQPRAYQLHHALGQALKKLGRAEAAAAQFRNVPESPTQRVGLRSKDPWLESIQELPVSATALERKGRQALLRGYLDTAADLFEQAEEIAPHRREIRFNLAMTYFSSGRSDLAEPKLVQLIEDHPDYSSSYRLLGRIYASRSQEADAVKYLKRAVEIDPEIESHHRALADFHLQRGRTAEARRGFREALRLDDRTGDAYLGLAQCLLLDGEGEAAVDAVEQGLRRQPQSKPLRWLALRVRAVDPGRFSSAFPNPPRTVFELESAAISRAVDGDLVNAAGLQGAALQAALKSADAAPSSISSRHLSALRRRLSTMEAGAVPGNLWAVGERPRVTVSRTGQRGAASPSRRR